MTITTPAPATTPDYVVQCAVCLGTNPTQPTEQLRQWAEFAGPCVCEVPEQPADPRVPGGTYFCGYWQQSYEVLAMWSGVQRGDTGWMRVRWADGTTTQHCTPWDSKRDRVIDEGNTLAMSDTRGSQPVTCPDCGKPAHTAAGAQIALGIMHDSPADAAACPANQH